MSSIPRKILLVVTQGHWGGAQRYVFDLALNFRSRGLQVEVAVGDAPNEELQQQLGVAGVRVHQLRHLVRSVSLLRDAAAVLELRRLIRSGSYDVVHLNSSKAGVVGSIATATISRSQRPRVVYTAHGWVFVEPLTKARLALYRFLERATASLKDVIICVSQASKDDAVAARVGRREQLVVVPIGLDTNALRFLSRAEARQQLAALAHSEIGESTPLVVAIANYYATKGIDILLAAWPGVLAKHPNAHVVVLGDGPLRAYLLKQRADLGLESSFHLPGTVASAYRLLRGADVFVLPSRKEGLPYALLEALAAELPIVATEVGAIPGVLANGRAGLLVPPGAPGDITVSLNALLGNEQLKQRLVKAASGQVQRGHSLAQMAEATLACYS